MNLYLSISSFSGKTKPISVIIFAQYTVKWRPTLISGFTFVDFDQEMTQGGAQSQMRISNREF